MSEKTIVDPDQVPLVVAVDLGGTQVRVAVLRGSTLLSRISEDTGADSTPDCLVPRIYHAIQEALDESCSELDQIKGIGIGVAGPLDSRTGVVFAAPNLSGWHNISLREIFQERYRVPIFVANDANAAALGEYMFGAGRGCKDLVYLTISTGIGGGVIINGQIVGGISGTAGELGHMTVDWRGGPCNCGNIGCLESIASGTAIAHRAQEAMGEEQGRELLAFARALQQYTGGSGQLDPPVQNCMNHKHVARVSDVEAPPMSARTVWLAAQAGIPLAFSLIKEAAEALGVGLVNIIHIFNPEMIILGGGVTQMGSLLLEPARQIVRDRAMQVPRKAVRIVQAHMDVDVGLVGAGALVYHSLGVNGVFQPEGMMVGAS